MSDYLAMCLTMLILAGMVAYAQYKYGTAAAVTVLIAIGVM